LLVVVVAAKPHIRHAVAAVVGFPVHLPILSRHCCERVERIATLVILKGGGGGGRDTSPALPTILGGRAVRTC